MLKKYRMTAFLVLLGINLLFHVGPFMSVMSLQGTNSSTVDLANIPGDYNFLMFPVASAVIYKTEKLLPTEKSGALTRAVGAEYKEIKSGAVYVLDEGFVSVSDLTYLPTINPEQYVKDWQAKIATSDYYTAGRWDVKDLASGHKQVTLELRDDKHVRSHTYSYETDGKHLFNISSVQLASGMAMAAFFLLCMRFLFFTGLIWVIVSRVFRN